MALIPCPECEKEVSDKVKTCPHCGYPFYEDPSMLPPQFVEVTPVKPILSSEQKKKRRTRMIITAVIAVIVAIGIFVAVSASKRIARAEYIENLSLAKHAMLTGAAFSEEICSLTQSVWHDTIYEEFSPNTYEYTQTSGRFNDDFNSSLSALYSASSTKETVSEIEENRSEVINIMRTLQNPPKDLVVCYDTIEAMYEVYWNFTNLAISPSGSLNSYTEDFRTYDRQFMNYYDKLERQLSTE